MEGSALESMVIDINKKDEEGNTALHRAVKSNDVTQVEQLLSQGIDVDVRGEHGSTPLHILASENYDDSHYKVAEILLKNGADVNNEDSLGYTPLWLLVENANLKMVKLFLSYNADFNVTNNSRNLLFPAVETYHINIDVLQLLIDLGLDLNHHNLDGDTPLHVTRKFLNFEALKCLLRNGANLNAVNYDGVTPLTEALNYDGDWIVDDDEENNIKELNFIMEHTDFNVHEHFIEDQNILCYESRDSFRKTVIEHLAKLQILEIPIHQTYFNNISNNYKKNEYFSECQEELRRTKNTKLNNSWLTFLNLLIDNKKKLKNYAGNSDLIEDFEKSNFAESFPIYGVAMDRNLKKGIRTRKLFDKSAIVLSDCLPIFNPSHLIIKNILDCILCKKDFSKLCK